MSQEKRPSKPTGGYKPISMPGLSLVTEIPGGENLPPVTFSSAVPVYLAAYCVGNRSLQKKLEERANAQPVDSDFIQAQLQMKRLRGEAVDEVAFATEMKNPYRVYNFNMGMLHPSQLAKEEEKTRDIKNLQEMQLKLARHEAEAKALEKEIEKKKRQRELTGEKNHDKGLASLKIKYASKSVQANVLALEINIYQAEIQRDRFQSTLDSEDSLTDEVEINCRRKISELNASIKASYVDILARRINNCENRLAFFEKQSALPDVQQAEKAKITLLMQEGESKVRDYKQELKKVQSGTILPGSVKRGLNKRKREEDIADPYESDFSIPADNRHGYNDFASLSSTILVMLVEQAIPAEQAFIEEEKRFIEKALKPSIPNRIAGFFLGRFKWWNDTYGGDKRVYEEAKAQLAQVERRHERLRQGIAEAAAEKVVRELGEISKNQFETLSTFAKKNGKFRVLTVDSNETVIEEEGEQKKKTKAETFFNYIQGQLRRRDLPVGKRECLKQFEDDLREQMPLVALRSDLNGSYELLNIIAGMLKKLPQNPENTASVLFQENQKDSDEYKTSVNSVIDTLKANYKNPEKVQENIDIFQAIIVAHKNHMPPVYASQKWQRWKKESQLLEVCLRALEDGRYQNNSFKLVDNTYRDNEWAGIILREYNVSKPSAFKINYSDTKLPFNGNEQSAFEKLVRNVSADCRVLIAQELTKIGLKGLSVGQSAEGGSDPARILQAVRDVLRPAKQPLLMGQEKFSDEDEEQSIVWNADPLVINAVSEALKRYEPKDGEENRHTILVRQYELSVGQASTAKEKGLSISEKVEGRVDSVDGTYGRLLDLVISRGVKKAGSSGESHVDIFNRYLPVVLNRLSNDISKEKNDERKNILKRKRDALRLLEKIVNGRQVSALSDTEVDLLNNLISTTRLSQSGVSVSGEATAAPFLIRKYTRDSIKRYFSADSEFSRYPAADEFDEGIPRIQGYQALFASVGLKEYEILPANEAKIFIDHYFSQDHTLVTQHNIERQIDRLNKAWIQVATNEEQLRDAREGVSKFLSTLNGRQAYFGLLFVSYAFRDSHAETWTTKRLGVLCERGEIKCSADDHAFFSDSKVQRSAAVQAKLNEILKNFINNPAFEWNNGSFGFIEKYANEECKQLYRLKGLRKVLKEGALSHLTYNMLESHRAFLDYLKRYDLGRDVEKIKEIFAEHLAHDFTGNPVNWSYTTDQFFALYARLYPETEGFLQTIDLNMVEYLLAIANKEETVNFIEHLREARVHKILPFHEGRPFAQEEKVKTEGVARVKNIFNGNFADTNVKGCWSWLEESTEFLLEKQSLQKPLTRSDAQWNAPGVWSESNENLFVYIADDSDLLRLRFARIDQLLQNKNSKDAHDYVMLVSRYGRPAPEVDARQEIAIDNNAIAELDRKFAHAMDNNKYNNATQRLITAWGTEDRLDDCHLKRIDELLVSDNPYSALEQITYWASLKIGLEKRGGKRPLIKNPQKAELLARKLQKAAQGPWSLCKLILVSEFGDPALRQALNVVRFKELLKTPLDFGREDAVSKALQKIYPQICGSDLNNPLESYGAPEATPFEKASTETINVENLFGQYTSQVYQAGAEFAQRSFGKSMETSPIQAEEIVCSSFFGAFISLFTDAFCYDHSGNTKAYKQFMIPLNQYRTKIVNGKLEENKFLSYLETCQTGAIQDAYISKLDIIEANRNGAINSEVTGEAKHYVDSYNKLVVSYVESALRYENEAHELDSFKNAIVGLTQDNGEYPTEEVLNLVDRFKLFVQDNYWFVSQEAKQALEKIEGSIETENRLRLFLYQPELQWIDFYSVEGFTELKDAARYYFKLYPEVDGLLIAEAFKKFVNQHNVAEITELSLSIESQTGTQYLKELKEAAAHLVFLLSPRSLNASHEEILDRCFFGCNSVSEVKNSLRLVIRELEARRIQSLNWKSIPKSDPKAPLVHMFGESAVPKLSAAVSPRAEAKYAANTETQNRLIYLCQNRKQIFEEYQKFEVLLEGIGRFTTNEDSLNFLSGENAEYLLGLDAVRKARLTKNITVLKKQYSDYPEVCDLLELVKTRLHTSSRDSIIMSPAIKERLNRYKQICASVTELQKQTPLTQEHVAQFQLHLKKNLVNHIFNVVSAAYHEKLSLDVVHCFRQYAAWVSLPEVETSRLTAILSAKEIQIKTRETLKLMSVRQPWAVENDELLLLQQYANNRLCGDPSINRQIVVCLGKLILEPIKVLGAGTINMVEVVELFKKYLGKAKEDLEAQIDKRYLSPKQAEEKRQAKGTAQANFALIQQLIHVKNSPLLKDPSIPELVGIAAIWREPSVLVKVLDKHINLKNSRYSIEDPQKEDALAAVNFGELLELCKLIRQVACFNDFRAKKSAEFLEKALGKLLQDYQGFCAKRPTQKLLFTSEWVERLIHSVGTIAQKECFDKEYAARRKLIEIEDQYLTKYYRDFRLAFSGIEKAQQDFVDAASVKKVKNKIDEVMSELEGLVQKKLLADAVSYQGDYLKGLLSIINAQSKTLFDLLEKLSNSDLKSYVITRIILLFSKMESKENAQLQQQKMSVLAQLIDTHLSVKEQEEWKAYFVNNPDSVDQHYKNQLANNIKKVNAYVAFEEGLADIQQMSTGEDFVSYLPIRLAELQQETLQRADSPTSRVFRKTGLTKRTFNLRYYEGLLAGVASLPESSLEQQSKKMLCTRIEESKEFLRGWTDLNAIFLSVPSNEMKGVLEAKLERLSKVTSISKDPLTKEDNDFLPTKPEKMYYLYGMQQAVRDYNIGSLSVQGKADFKALFSDGTSSSGDTSPTYSSRELSSRSFSRTSSALFGGSLKISTEERLRTLLASLDDSPFAYEANTTYLNGMRNIAHELKESYGSKLSKLLKTLEGLKSEDPAFKEITQKSIRLLEQKKSELLNAIAMIDAALATQNAQKIIYQEVMATQEFGYRLPVLKKGHAEETVRAIVSKLKFAQSQPGEEAVSMMMGKLKPAQSKSSAALEKLFSDGIKPVSAAYLANREYLLRIEQAVGIADLDPMFSEKVTEIITAKREELNKKHDEHLRKENSEKYRQDIEEYQESRNKALVKSKYTNSMIKKGMADFVVLQKDQTPLNWARSLSELLDRELPVNLNHYLLYKDYLFGLREEIDKIDTSVRGFESLKEHLLTIVKEKGQALKVNFIKAMKTNSRALINAGLPLEILAPKIQDDQGYLEERIKQKANDVREALSSPIALKISYYDALNALKICIGKSAEDISFNFNTLFESKRGARGENDIGDFLSWLKHVCAQISSDSTVFSEHFIRLAAEIIDNEIRVEERYREGVSDAKKIESSDDAIKLIKLEFQNSKTAMHSLRYFQGLLSAFSISITANAEIREHILKAIAQKQGYLTYSRLPSVDKIAAVKLALDNVPLVFQRYDFVYGLYEASRECVEENIADWSELQVFENLLEGENEFSLARIAFNSAEFKKKDAKAALGQLIQDKKAEQTVNQQHSPKGFRVSRYLEGLDTCIPRDTQHQALRLMLADERFYKYGYDALLPLLGSNPKEMFEKDKLFKLVLLNFRMCVVDVVADTSIKIKNYLEGLSQAIDDSVYFTLEQKAVLKGIVNQYEIGNVAATSILIQDNPVLRAKETVLKASEIPDISNLYFNGMQAQLSDPIYEGVLRVGKSYLDIYHQTMILLVEQKTKEKTEKKINDVLDMVKNILISKGGRDIPFRINLVQGIIAAARDSQRDNLMTEIKSMLLDFETGQRDANTLSKKLPIEKLLERKKKAKTLSKYYLAGLGQEISQSETTDKAQLLTSVKIAFSYVNGLEMLVNRKNVPECLRYIKQTITHAQKVNYLQGLLAQLKLQKDKGLERTVQGLVKGYQKGYRAKISAKNLLELLNEGAAFAEGLTQKLRDDNQVALLNLATHYLEGYSDHTLNAVKARISSTEYSVEEKTMFLNGLKAFLETQKTIANSEEHQKLLTYCLGYLRPVTQRRLRLKNLEFRESMTQKLKDTGNMRLHGLAVHFNMGYADFTSDVGTILDSTPVLALVEKLLSKEGACQDKLFYLEGWLEALEQSNHSIKARLAPILREAISDMRRGYAETASIPVAELKEKNVAYIMGAAQRLSELKKDNLPPNLVDSLSIEKQRVFATLKNQKPPVSAVTSVRRIFSATPTVKRLSPASPKKKKPASAWDPRDIVYGRAGSAAFGGIFASSSASLCDVSSHEDISWLNVEPEAVLPSFTFAIDNKIDVEPLTQLIQGRVDAFANGSMCQFLRMEDIVAFNRKKEHSDRASTMSVLMQNIASLQVGQTLLVPINHDDEHFTLLAIRGLANGERKAVYVDSIADFGNASVSIDMLCKDIGFPVETLCKSYQINNDCAVHTEANAGILLTASDENFSAAGVWEEIERQRLTAPAVATLQRLNFAQRTLTLPDIDKIYTAVTISPELLALGQETKQRAKRL